MTTNPNSSLLALPKGEGWGGAFGLFFHYLKIAFRNMWKYKSQTAISLIGLAVGFTCFAMATLWIRYELTFDNFHTNAKQMYVVYAPYSFSSSGYGRNTGYPLAAFLKETFPEIKDAIPLAPSFTGTKVTVEGMELPALVIMADTSLFRMFEISILEGSRDFLVPNSRKLAITHEKARQLFGNEHPIGKTVQYWFDECTICAVVSDMPKRSNYAYDFIAPFRAESVDPRQNRNTSYGENTIIELLPGTNVEAFEKKLFAYEDVEKSRFKQLKIKPITKLRYLDPDIIREVKLPYIFIFALSGLLVILCSLFNYLSLFVSRFRIRQKELALRVVCGASGNSLLAMLTVEFLLVLLFAVMLGGMLTDLVYDRFLNLSGISMALPAIYRESLFYISGVVLLSLLAFWLILYIFQRRNLNVSIRRSNNKLFRKVSVIVQLVISIGFAFCTVVILKQMYFLHHTVDLGFSLQNRGSITLQGAGGSSVLANHLKQIPEITEVVETERLVNFLPQTGTSRTPASIWDGKPVDAEDISIERMFVSPAYISFYEFRLLTGEILTEADPDTLVLINESAAKAFGWHEAVGKTFSGNYMRRYSVKGVIKDIYNLAPVIQPKPAYYLKLSPDERTGSFGGTSALFKYEDGMWKSCKQKIELLMQNEYADLSYKAFYNTEEEYDKFFKAETSLIELLSIVAVICILICVFGFVSLVSLTCEERRKDIAIRKINGATSGDILGIFAKEYTLLLLIGSVIAFTTGYYIMRRWLEQYVLQTNIPVWIYLSILCVMALVIVLCVGWQVYRASVENPARTVSRDG